MKAVPWIVGIILLVVVMESGRRSMMGTHCGEVLRTELAAPDGKRTAMVVDLDCGAGGSGTGVAIREGNAPFTGKEPLAFHADGKHPVLIRWLDKDRLEIKSTSAPESAIKDMAATSGGVNIVHVRN